MKSTKAKRVRLLLAGMSRQHTPLHSGAGIVAFYLKYGWKRPHIELKVSGLAGNKAFTAKCVKT